MKPYCERVGVALYHADCLQLLPTLAECSVDTVVTDPPYELTGKHGPRSPQYAEGGKAHYGERTGGFMGMAWDATGIAFRVETWQTILRVLKPGGYLLAFGGTRTYHRMVCAIEDAGFEVRDCVMWLYGSGFPKSLDVSKALDKAAGAEREVVGFHTQTMPQISPRENFGSRFGDEGGNNRITVPATDAAREWSGWGTALKPAYEPILLCRKPLSERNVAANVLKWGTGAINVDGCRIEGPAWKRDTTTKNDIRGGHLHTMVNHPTYECPPQAMPAAGRWPANLVLSHLPECREVGVRRVKGSYLNHEVHGDNTQFAFRGKASTHNTGYADPDGTEMVPSWECAPGCPVAMLDEQSGERKGAVSNGSSGSNPSLFNPGRLLQVPSYADSGGASRFFYTAKASRSERGEGNNHPTVKPLSLMRYLCRLVTPPGGLILDPFTGSGTTALAAILEGFRFVGAEQDERYCEIAARRLSQEVLPLEEALP